MIKIKLVSFFSEDHENTFDHKYHIDPGNLFSIHYILQGLAKFFAYLLPPDRRQSKTLILSTNKDQKSFKTEFSIAICRPTGGSWQSKTLFLASFDPHSSMVMSFFDCRFCLLFNHSFCLSSHHQIIYLRQIARAKIESYQLSRAEPNTASPFSMLNSTEHEVSIAHINSNTNE